MIFIVIDELGYLPLSQSGGQGQRRPEGEGRQSRYGIPLPASSGSRCEASLDRVSPWR
jgi:hypothetical protein